MRKKRKQKFPTGTRVRIANELPIYMRHFDGKGELATVIYTYAQAYGGYDYKSYCLDIDGLGITSWYEENLLTKVK